MLSNVYALIPRFKYRNISSSSVYRDGVDKNASHTYKPTNFDKRLLVWTGKFKTINDVPSYITPELLQKTHSWARIRLANYLMVLTLIGCGYMAYRGKMEQKAGMSLHQQNLDWHKEYNERK